MSASSRVLAATLLLLFAAPLSGPALADAVLTIKVHHDGMPQIGTPPVDGESTLWLVENRARRDDGAMSVIVRSDTKKLFLIDHEEKAYSELDLPLDIRRLVPPEQAAAIQAQLSSMRFETKITPADETKTVGQWPARRYLLQVDEKTLGVRVTMELWATKQIAVDIAAYRSLLSALSDLEPMAGALMREMLAVDGFPVLTEQYVTMNDVSVGSREELLRVETREAPSGTYDPPAGYAKRPFDPLGGEHGH